MCSENKLNDTYLVELKHVNYVDCSDEEKITVMTGKRLLSQKTILHYFGVYNKYDHPFELAQLRWL